MDEKKKIIEAIGELGRQVTVADVATKTGLPVLKVAQSLNQVAAETGGHMLVASSGDIAYKFKPGFSNAYLAHGLKLFLQKAFGFISNLLLYLLKISFGIMLILSLIMVGILIFVIVIRGEHNSDKDRRDSGFNISFFDWLIIRDLLYWGSYNSYSKELDYRRPSTARRRKSNFLLNCFSFLFGDGDPNYGFKEKQWQIIAEIIKKNKNVLTAEQLAPYTGTSPDNEDAVLPVLVRFNGKPEVTKSGNIIYTFESMQASTANIRTKPPSYLAEFPWQFTVTPQEELIPVYIVAALNLFGSWGLLFYIYNHGLAELAPLVALLVLYGSAFCITPIIRLFINRRRNKKIEQRNDKRIKYAGIVATPPEKLKVKLKEADSYKSSSNKIDMEDLAYTTEKDSLDQEDDLDKKFRDQLERNFDASP